MPCTVARTHRYRRGMAAVAFDVPEAGIARITLHRPEVLNAIDGARLDGLDVALDRLGWLHPL